MLGVERERVLHSSRLACVPGLWRRGQDWSQAPARASGVQDSLLERLAQPGGVVHMLVDAYWEKPGAHRRPFAGVAERGFALGVARIARLSQCPIVPYATGLGGAPRSEHFECGPLMEPPALDDKAADVRVTDELVDWLERAVARYPQQFSDPIGADRRWDAARERWV